MCVHNAGRSQMAAALLRLRSHGRIDVRSAGSEPADALHPAVVEAMAELGVDLRDAAPTRLSTDAVRDADVVVTMGCGDACPVYPGKRYEDWQLDDPAGRDLDECGGSGTRSTHASRRWLPSWSELPPSDGTSLEPRCSRRYRSDLRGRHRRRRRRPPQHSR